MRPASVVQLIYRFVVALAMLGANQVLAQPRTAGSDIEVGAFRMHVQLAQRRVVLQDMRGSNAAAVPATQISVAFSDWNPADGAVTLHAAVRNTGSKSLFAPLRVVVTKLASPLARAVNPDAGSGAGSWAWNYAGPPLAIGRSTAEKTWQFVSPSAADFQAELKVYAGVPLTAGTGGTVTGVDGSSVTVPANALPYEALVDIRPFPVADLPASSSNLPVVGAVEVILQPAEQVSELKPVTAKLILSIPTPPASLYSRFIVAQPILADSISGTPALRHQLMPTDTAETAGAQITTNGVMFAGIRGGGVFAFLANTGSGFASGMVTEAGAPRAGVVVSNNTNTLVAVTDGSGNYQLFVNGGPFTVTAFDPFRGSLGSTAGNIVAPQSTVAANIAVAPVATPPVTRDGVRNGAFERGDLSSWATTGAATVRQQLGPTSTGVVIRPTEGQWMADISTGTGSVGGVGSGLKQRFIVPAGVQSLKVDFNFVSEEFPEFVGSVFDDAFRAIVTTPNGQMIFAQVSVNVSGGFQLIGDCFFPGGDTTCGQTGWRTGSVDLSPFAGTDQPIQVELLFTATDAGDNIYDTHVLVDNIRFSTLWIDAKTMVGSSAAAARVQADVRQATEVLSQAGINVRLRGTRSIADPGTLLDTDATWTTDPVTTLGVRTAEETQLLGLNRSATTTDLNVYYVRSLTGLGALAIAIGPNDFQNAAIATNAGVITTDAAFPETLAHEIGHLLISPDRAGSALEHNVGVANNLMNAPRTVPRNLVSRQQSGSINAAGVALVP